jgi:GNAT superfamily N-acetyltransferase
VIREATDADQALVHRLRQEFEREIPDLPWREADDDSGNADLVLLADEDGFAAVTKHQQMWFVDVLYVRPSARGRGLAPELMLEVARRAQDAGVEMLELEVLEHNELGRRLYDSLGFETVERVLAGSPGQLLAERAGGPTFGRVHVQTDDVDAVTRNVQKVMPRFGGRSGYSVSDVSNGWIRVQSGVTDEDPQKLRALAKELSFTSGVAIALGIEDGAVVRYVVFDRGSMVDEYASLPEYRGSLPPGDVVALAANPTVLARLTGADPHRVREVARTGASPTDLPPAAELYEAIADVLGLEVD